MAQLGGQTLGETAAPEDGRRTATIGPALILAFECHRPRASAAWVSLSGITDLGIGRGSARELQTIDQHEHLTVPDRWMSSQHARLRSSFGRWILEDCGSKNGTRVNGVATARHELQCGDVIELGRSFFVFRASADDGAHRFEDFEHAPAPRTLHPSLARELEKIQKIAQTPVAILILGQSGTGKEVMAELVHGTSGRSGELVAVNCGALPEGLVESELFGHKKGAFSGAVQDHVGLVRKAHGGTLFLDEIADLPASSQAALLRVLQEREVRPVGDTRSISVDLRTIAATHMDLEARVEAGQFRRDLFARIASYRLTLPPLAERREDLGLLIADLISREDLAIERIELEAARALFQYHWPMNVRELKSSLATAAVLCSDGAIELEHLPEPLREAGISQHAILADSRSASVGASGSTRMEDEELRRQLTRLLRTHRGNVSAIARELDKDRKQIQRWLKRFDLDAETFRDA